MAIRANIVINTLKKNAIKVERDMKAVYPKTTGEKTIDVEGLVPKFNRCYAICNFTVCFVHDNEVFVTPYTREIVRMLRAESFSEKFFYVPFCYGDYPKGHKRKWDTLRKLAEKSYLDTFVEDCLLYCDNHNIKKISPDSMKNCFKIPDTGIEIRYQDKEMICHPIINSTFIDSIDMYHLGKYNYKNGIVIFVYRDGKSYLTKGYRIIDELKRKGYEHAPLAVPLASGEEIVDPKLKAEWDKIAL